MIQRGFQGLTEGKQTDTRVRGKQSATGEKGATDLFDGKLQRVLGGDEEEVDSTRVKYRLDALPTSAFPAGYVSTHGQPANIYLFRKQILSSPSFVPIRLLVSSCRLKPFLGHSETPGAFWHPPDVARNLTG